MVACKNRIYANSSQSEYEAEAWETGTRHSDDTGYDSKPRSRSHTRSRPASPHTYNHASQTGDYYRDTNLLHANGSSTNLRAGSSQLSHSNVSLHGGMRQASMPFGAPQLPTMAFAGSVSGSDHGHMMHMMAPMPYHTGSVYGMPPMLPPQAAMMTGMSMFGGVSPSGSQVGAAPVGMGVGAGARPTSTFSMATSVNLFAGPSNNPNPSDEELFSVLRNYLSTQDLRTVTKK